MGCRTQQKTAHKVQLPTRLVGNDGYSVTISMICLGIMTIDNAYAT